MEGVHPLPPPRLAGVPDARRGRLPLFEPFFFPYAGIILGAAGAALAGLYNALLLRRAGAALLALAVLAGGWLAAVTGSRMAAAAGLENPYLMVLFARGIGLVFGLILMRRQKLHFQGHAHQGGDSIPLLYSVLGAGALVFFLLPAWVTALFLGLVQL